MAVWTASVLTQNMYLGADLAPLVLAADREAFLHAEREALAEVRSADPEGRVAALAAIIARAAPDVVALQEVAAWDFGDGTACHFLPLLLAGLPGYRPVAAAPTMALEAPAWAQRRTRLAVSNAILARTTAAIGLTRDGVFQAGHTIPSPMLGEVRVARSWCAVQASGAWFVNTHLDDLSPEVQLAQAQELLAVLAEMEDPLVVAGDFNSNAAKGAGATPAYPALLAAALADAWPARHPGEAGPTWAGQRLDLVLTRGEVAVDAVTILAPGISSDHAGLLAELRFRV